MENQELKNWKEKNKSLFSALIVVLGLFLAVLVISTAVDVQNKIREGKYIGQEFKNTISVSAEGEIFAKPDLALTSFSVITEAKTVAKALAENSKKMNSIIDFIKSQGVAEKDLKTTSFNIFPRYEYQRVETEIYPYPPGKRVLVGYEVQQSLEVKIRDLAKIGEIIEGATRAGANQVGDLRFTIDKEEELKNQARKEAIEKAKTRAKELASQLGVKLVRITNFSESGFMPVPFFGLKEAAIGGGEAPQIEVGENKISVTVSIAYEIR